MIIVTSKTKAVGNRAPKWPFVLDRNFKPFENVVASFVFANGKMRSLTPDVVGDMIKESQASNQIISELNTRSLSNPLNDATNVGAFAPHSWNIGAVTAFSWQTLVKINPLAEGNRTAGAIGQHEGEGAAPTVDWMGLYFITAAAQFKHVFFLTSGNNATGAAGFDHTVPKLYSMGGTWTDGTNNLKAYTNGVIDGQGTNNFGTINAAKTFQVGRAWNNTPGFNFYNANLWDSVISADDMLQLYEPATRFQGYELTGRVVYFLPVAGAVAAVKRLRGFILNVGKLMR